MTGLKPAYKSFIASNILHIQCTRISYSCQLFPVQCTIYLCLCATCINRKVSFYAIISDNPQQTNFWNCQSHVKIELIFVTVWLYYVYSFMLQHWFLEMINLFVTYCFLIWSLSDILLDLFQTWCPSFVSRSGKVNDYNLSMTVPNYCQKEFFFQKGRKTTHINVIIFLT